MKKEEIKPPKKKFEPDSPGFREIEIQRIAGIIDEEFKEEQKRRMRDPIENPFEKKREKLI
jgi:hypothetical protein